MAHHRNDGKAVAPVLVKVRIQYHRMLFVTVHYGQSNRSGTLNRTFQLYGYLAAVEFKYYFIPGLFSPPAAAEVIAGIFCFFGIFFKAIKLCIRVCMLQALCTFPGIVISAISLCP